MNPGLKKYIYKYHMAWFIPVCMANPRLLQTEQNSAALEFRGASESQHAVRTAGDSQKFSRWHRLLCYCFQGGAGADSDIWRRLHDHCSLFIRDPIDQDMQTDVGILTFAKRREVGDDKERVARKDWCNISSGFPLQNTNKLVQRIKVIGQVLWKRGGSIVWN